MNANVKNANKLQGYWKNAGVKQTIKYNKQYGTDFIHDVDLMGDIISNLTPQQQEKLVLRSTALKLRDEIGNTRTLKGTGDLRTYMQMYSYVLDLLGKKFGKDAVQTNLSHGFRGVKNTPEIKDYARDLMKVTLDRIIHLF